jgi:hypothetical protein
MEYITIHQIPIYLQNSHWNCSRCGCLYSKEQYNIDECIRCTHRDLLYNDPKSLDKYLGQCPRCSRIVPSSLPCNFFWQMNTENLRSSRLTMLKNIAIWSRNERRFSYFCPITGIYGLDHDVQSTNNSYEEHTLKLLPRQTVEWYNNRNYFYCQDTHEREVEIEINKVLKNREWVRISQ